MKEIKKGRTWKIHETCVKKKGSNMTNIYRSNFVNCVWRLPGLPRCERWYAIEKLTVCLHILLLSCVSIHAWCHLSPSPPLFLCSFPACQAHKPNQALISGSMFTFYCVLWHPLISLIPIWYQIIDSVGLLAKSGVFYRGYTLRSPVWLSLSLYNSHHLHAGILFYVDYITQC